MWTGFAALMEVGMGLRRLLAPEANGQLHILDNTAAVGSKREFAEASVGDRVLGKH